MTNKERLDPLYSKCVKICLDLKIPIGTVIEVTTFKSIRRVGWCEPICRQNKRYFRIAVNERLFKLGDREIENTLLHELLHTCFGCGNHGKLWKSYAQKINNEYKYNIKRTAKSDIWGNEENKSDFDEYKYIYKCEKCGTLVKRQRQSAFTQNPNNFFCVKCRADKWLIIKCPDFQSI